MTKHLEKQLSVGKTYFRFEDAMGKDCYLSTTVVHSRTDEGKGEMCAQLVLEGIVGGRIRLTREMSIEVIEKLQGFIETGEL